MINKVLENQNLLKLLFSFSILLIFLDSYQVLNTPLSWVGNLLLTLICLIIFRKEKIEKQVNADKLSEFLLQYLD